MSSGGSDWVGGSGQAQKVDGGYRIHARKPFASGTPVGTILMTTAIADEESGPTVLHFGAPLAAEGMRVEDVWDALGMRGTGSQDIVLDGLFVPDDRVALKRKAGEWHPLFHIIGTIAIPLIYALIEPGYEIRRRSFRNSADVPNATEQRGRLQTAYLNVSGVFLPELRWNVRVAHNRVDALTVYNSFRSTSVDVGLAYEFDPVVIESARKWTLSPFVGFTRSSYEGPNAVVDPNLIRKDREWRFGAGLDAPIWANAGLGLMVQYANTKSNIANYSTKNFSVTFGPTVRF